MTKRIPLHGKYGKGKFVLVDDADFEWLNQYRWRCDGGGYVGRGEGGKTILMHRQILKPKRGQVVDHANHDPLDNRRCNIRIATVQENTRNQLPQSERERVSRYKGVNWEGRLGLWSASLVVDRSPIYLGSYLTQREAAAAYNATALERFGDFAYLNEIPEDDPDDQPVQRLNSGPVKTNPYRGVRKGGGKGRWQANIMHDGEWMHLGEFPSPELAARVYDAACLKHRGDRSMLNFPESWENPIDIDRPIVVQAIARRQGAKSQFVGVTRNRGKKESWKARIGQDGGRIDIGTFPTEEEAARAYDAAAYAKGGKVIPLNFPSEWPNYHPTTPTGETHK